MFRRRPTDDFAAEIEAHLAHEVERWRAEGLSEAEARAAAHRAFGNVLRTEERFYESGRWLAWDHVWLDVRFGARLLRRRPGFAIVAILTLALGIAINATIFSLVSAFVLRRPPVPDVDRVVVVSAVSPVAGFLTDAMPVSPAAYLDWRGRVAAFGATAAADEDRRVNFAAATTTELVHAAVVTPGYFDLLGARATLGRAIAPGDDQPGRAHVVVLGEGLWRREFAADPSALGRTVRINREAYTVVGVMPGDFRLLGFTPELWTPLVLGEADRSIASRAGRSLVMLARLAPGATLAQAREQVAALARQSAQAHPAVEKGWGGAVRTLPDYLVYTFGIVNALAVLMTVVGFVLLIACANVAGLLLARAAARGKEVAIRRSLGASRGRIVRQLATEGLVLTLAGGAAGLLLTVWGVRYFQSAMTFNDAVSAVDIHLDWRVVIFTMAVSIACALLVGIAPGLGASRIDVRAALTRESRAASSSRSQTRLRTVLVTGEIALAMFLLLGTGLLLRSLLLIEHQRLGFQPEVLLTARVQLDERYTDGLAQVTFARALRARLSALPGAQQVAIASDLPATGANRAPVRIRGLDGPAAEPREVADVVVSEGFFETAGIPLLRGRTFTEADTAESAGVVVLNDEFVRRYLKDRDPLTTAVALPTPGAAPRWLQVVGVVANVKSYSEAAAEAPEVFEAFAQRPLRGFSLMIRSAVDPASLAAPLRSAIASLDVDLPASRVLTMEAVIEGQRKGDAIFVRLLALFAVLALVLSTVGLYGLIAYSLGQRQHEIAIRLAMGARRSVVLGLVLRQGVVMALVGCGAGLLMALPLPRVLDSMFNGLDVQDAGMFVAVPLVLFAVTMAATLMPARRALGVDPIVTLRHE